MNRYYSNVLYNGIVPITLPLSSMVRGFAPSLVARVGSESKVVSTHDRTRIKREKLQTLVYLPHSIIRGDNYV